MKACWSTDSEGVDDRRGVERPRSPGPIPRFAPAKASRTPRRDPRGHPPRIRASAPRRRAARSRARACRTRAKFEVAPEHAPARPPSDHHRRPGRRPRRRSTHRARVSARAALPPRARRRCACAFELRERLGADASAAGAGARVGRALRAREPVVKRRCFTRDRRTNSRVRTTKGENAGLLFEHLARFRGPRGVTARVDRAKRVHRARLIGEYRSRDLGSKRSVSWHVESDSARGKKSRRP